MTFDYLPNFYQTITWKELNEEEKEQFEHSFNEKLKLQRKAPTTIKVMETENEIEPDNSYDYDKESVMYSKQMGLMEEIDNVS